MTKKAELWLTGLVLAGSLVLFSILAFLSQGSYGGADELIHYRFSRYAFDYPHFFLDHWAKPVYTTLSSPFAQFGLVGQRLFSVFAGVLAAFCTFRSARLLGYKNTFLAPLFVLFAPIYAVMMPTAMTEILFSLVLIASIFLFLKKKYIFSAIVLSFLPFVRTEGVVIFGIFGIAYLFHKQFKALPFLFTGFVFFSIVGAFHYHDLLWVINKMPYGNAQDIYGSGSLWHFAKQAKHIFGIPLTVVLLIGFVVLVFKYLKKRNYFFAGRELNELLVVFGSFFIYFAAHSVVWWLGKGASLGLIRVMAAVIPPAALVGLKGFNRVIQKIEHQKWIKYGIIAVFAVLYVRTAFAMFHFPVELSRPQKVVKKTAEWLKNSEFYQQKIYYYDPYFFLFLDLNPYDTARIQELIPDRDTPENGIAQGSIVLWDAHFSPNEGGLPLKKLMQNPHFKVLNVFRPVQPFTVLGGHNYEIFVFQRIAYNDSLNNAELLKKIESQKDSLYESKTLKYFDYETQTKGLEKQNFCDTLAHTGSRSLIMDKNREFSPDFRVQFAEIQGNENSRFKVRVFVYPLGNFEPENLLLVASAEDSDIYLYLTRHLAQAKKHKNGWFELSLEFPAAEIKSSDDLLAFYIWNKGKVSFLADDLLIQRLDSK